MMASYIMGFWAANFVLYNIDYLTVKPIYMCESTPSSGQYGICEYTEICIENPPNYYIDWGDDLSLDNWSQTLDLKCVSKKRIDRISSVYYFGEIFGCLMISRIPDLVGRKWPYSTCLALQLPCFIIIWLSRSLTLTTITGFFMGILHIGVANGGYINVCEYVHDKWKNVVCTIMLVFDMLTVIGTGIYWKYVSKNANGLMIFGILQNAIGLIGCLFLPETPEYLYSFYRFRECKEVIHNIAKWNKSDLYKSVMLSQSRIITSVKEVEGEEDKDESVSLTQAESEDGQSLVFHYQFDVEADLKQIVWERMIAEQNEKYRYSVEKGNEIMLEIEVQRSVKAGIR